MKTAGEEVVLLHKEDPSLTNQKADGMVGTTVTCDGTWHKRGYTSLHGVRGSLVTGQLLDLQHYRRRVQSARSGASELELTSMQFGDQHMNVRPTFTAMECEGA